MVLKNPAFAKRQNVICDFNKTVHLDRQNKFSDSVSLWGNFCNFALWTKIRSIER